MEVEYFGAKFFRNKFSDLLTGQTVVSYQEQSGLAEPFTIKISREGMWFEGKQSKKVITEMDLQSFAKMISDLWSEHRTLAPQLTTTLSGH